MHLPAAEPTATASPAPSPPPPPLTIRNLTITPLELTRVDVLEAHPVRGPWGLASLTSAIASLFNPASAAPALCAVPRPGVAPKQTHVLAPHVALVPFSAVAPPCVPAAEPNGRSILRLTLSDPRTGRVYTVDAPPATTRSVELACASDSGESGGENASGIAAVYASGASRGGGAVLALQGGGPADRWMGALDDAVPLAALSVPGTHNSAACYAALPSVRCQAVGVRAQLDNGVRFLDVRVACAAGAADPALVHSAFPVSLLGAARLSALLADVYAFLRANPSEAVLLSLKREGLPATANTDAELARHLRAHHTRGDTAARWFTEPRLPLLGEARGRIVLLRRFGLDGRESPADWGVDATAWPDNCADGTVAGGLVRVQDFYEVLRTAAIQRKIELACAHLARAAQQKWLPSTITTPSLPPPPLFLNFLSASNFFNASCWPESIAARVNPAVIEYLCAHHGSEKAGEDASVGPGHGGCGTGVVITDWVGLRGDWDLVRCVVAWNATLPLKERAAAAIET